MEQEQPNLATQQHRRNADMDIHGDLIKKNQESKERKTKKRPNPRRCP